MGASLLALAKSIYYDVSIGWLVQNFRKLLLKVVHIQFQKRHLTKKSNRLHKGCVLLSRRHLQIVSFISICG